jgi:hypothetical protein
MARFILILVAGLFAFAVDGASSFVEAGEKNCTSYSQLSGSLPSELEQFRSKLSRGGMIKRCLYTEYTLVSLYTEIKSVPTGVCSFEEQMFTLFQAGQQSSGRVLRFDHMQIPLGKTCPPQDDIHYVATRGVTPAVFSILERLLRDMESRPELLNNSARHTDAEKQSALHLSSALKERPSALRIFEIDRSTSWLSASDYEVSVEDAGTKQIFSMVVAVREGASQILQITSPPR